MDKTKHIMLHFPSKIKKIINKYRKQKYKKLSQIYSKLLRIAKATYFDEQIKLAKYDMKQTYDRDEP